MCSLMCTMYCLFVCPPADVSVSWFCRLEDLYEKIVMELMGKCNICLNLDNSWKAEISSEGRVFSPPNKSVPKPIVPKSSLHDTLKDKKA